MDELETRGYGRAVYPLRCGGAVVFPSGVRPAPGMPLAQVVPDALWLLVASAILLPH